MLITEKGLQHWIDNFYGYGSWNARFWFIAPEEESGDSPQEVADKLDYFYWAHPPESSGDLCDIRELYKHVAFSVTGPRADLFNSLFEYRFGSRAVQHGTWKNLIAFVHGYSGKPLPDLHAYQKKTLALASKKSEALLRLFPLPAHSHAWYYSWLDLPHLGFLKSRAAYQEHVYESRMESILKNMNAYKPEVVLMYGMTDINRIKKLVQAFFPGVKFKGVKAIGRKIPQHHRADFSGTTLLITTQIPALRHNRIETGFDWQAFGKSLMG
ncbi:MAG: hypothetical protein SH819_05375 [Cytophagales bacterium]|nr:hypothetical protein [Cytophagales bacterium]